MARFRRFGEQMLVFRKVYIGPLVFKTNLDNDSDIDQSGCTALPTYRRHVVIGTHCVGVSVLTNRLREMHARGGHCLRCGTVHVAIDAIRDRIPLDIIWLLTTGFHLQINHGMFRQWGREEPARGL